MKVRFFLVILVLSISSCRLSSSDSSETINSSASSSEETIPPAAAGGESEAARPEAVVADLYEQHDAKKSPFFQSRSRTLVDKYFTKQLADLIWKDAVTSAGEIGALDADPLYNAQDIEIKDLKVWPAEMTGDKAMVKVTFSNYSDKNSLMFSLDLIKGAWKIADIDYGRNETLVTWLKSAPPESTGDELGDFRGKYIVGDTSCTVEFKNKGYAVKWAKGSGLEYFSFIDGTTFASSTVESEANKFVFDDENYNAGTFYRADGKTFPVKRAK